MRQGMSNEDERILSELYDIHSICQHQSQRSFPSSMLAGPFGERALACSEVHIAGVVRWGGGAFFREGSDMV